MKLRKLKSVAPARASSMKLPAVVVTTRSTAATTGSGIPLKLVAPTAKRVFVAGSFNDWRAGAIPLRASADGEWRGELKLPPGRYEYLSVVDGQVAAGPRRVRSRAQSFRRIELSGFGLLTSCHFWN
jgi:1,4-alpha-glucan branching enzyme